jgi:hypothetical protein
LPCGFPLLCNFGFRCIAHFCNHPLGETLPVDCARVSVRALNRRLIESPHGHVNPDITIHLWSMHETRTALTRYRCSSVIREVVGAISCYSQCTNSRSCREKAYSSCIVF